MNEPLDERNDWSELAASGPKEVSGPAIYRTAFNDQNLIVSLSRRLVQATIFQALSRLRASDAARTNRKPKAEVNETDCCD